MNENFLHRLDMLRELYGKPLVITSGYRCKTHNNTVGGAEKSLHTEGCAVDIAIKGDSGTFRYDIIKLALQLGFTGIGVANSFIHVSLHETKHEGVYKY